MQQRTRHKRTKSKIHGQKECFIFLNRRDNAEFAEGAEDYVARSVNEDVDGDSVNVFVTIHRQLC